MKLVFGDPESIQRRDLAMKARKYGRWGLKKIAYMHEAFGHVADKKCRDCAALRSYDANSVPVNKCANYGDSRSTATDWRQKWDACGLFKPKGQVSDSEELGRRSTEGSQTAMQGDQR